jgi:predicted nuclease with TOPRIM domain
MLVLTIIALYSGCVPGGDWKKKYEELKEMYEITLKVNKTLLAELAFLNNKINMQIDEIETLKSREKKYMENVKEMLGKNGASSDIQKQSGFCTVCHALGQFSRP